MKTHAAMHPRSIGLLQQFIDETPSQHLHVRQQRPVAEMKDDVVGRDALVMDVPSPSRARKARADLESTTARAALALAPEGGRSTRTRSSPPSRNMQKDLESLEAIDWSVGVLEPYLERLRQRFVKPQQIVDKYVHKVPSGNFRLDPSFFDDFGVDNFQHRTIFEAWFLRSVSEAPAHAACHVGPPRRARSATPRPACASREQQLRLSINAWLESMDHGKGIFLQDYGSHIAQRFSSVAAVVDQYVSSTGQLDPAFFSDFKVKKIGHRRLFERFFSDVGSANS